MTSFSIRLYRLYTQFNINFAFRLRKKSAGQQHLRCSPAHTLSSSYKEAIFPTQAHYESYSPYSQPMCVASTSSTSVSAPSFLS